MKKKQFLSLILVWAAAFLLLQPAHTTYAASSGELPEVASVTMNPEAASGDYLPVEGMESLSDSAESGETDSLLPNDLLGASELPASYTSPILSHISNQGSYGTCWAFSSLTVAETWMLNNGAQVKPDFSEKQLVYSTFFGKGDHFIPMIKSGSSVVTGWNSWYSALGNYQMVTADLARGYGAADEASYPYTTSLLSESDLTNDIANVNSVRFLSDWPTAESDWKGAAWTDVTTAVKQAVVDSGAVMVAVLTSGQQYSSATNSYYSNWSTGVHTSSSGYVHYDDHAVSIVGWDDSKETQDTGNTGAWLVQNSWGSSSGDSGYCWIAYNDASLSSPTAIEMENSDLNNLRDRDTFCYTGTGFSISLKSANAVKGANVFTAEKNEYIDRVGFYTLAGTTWHAEVVTDMSDPSDPSSGTVAAQADGTTACGGFYKADLSAGVQVDAGESFAVVLTESFKKSAEENTYYVLFESTSSLTASVTSAAGQSFYYNGSSYQDSTKGIATKQGTSNYNNICIYAYGNASITGAKVSGLDPVYLFSGSEIKPVPTLTVNGTILREGTDYSLSYSDNIAAGKASVTVNGEGAYRGSMTLRFYIFKTGNPVSGKSYVLIPKKNPDLAVDVQNGGITNFSRLWLYGRNGTEAQIFTLAANADGTFQFVNEKSELSIDVMANSQQNGAAVQVYDCNYTDAQKWIFESNSDGTYTICNKYSGKVIDIPAGNAVTGNYLQMYVANGTDAQRFYLIETPADAHTFDGTYTILSSKNQSFAIDVSGASSASRANIQLWQSNGTGAQKFRFLYSGGGYYRILNVNSGCAVDVCGGNPANWVNIWQYAYNGSDAQLWAVKDNGDGTVTFLNKKGKALDLAGANTANGTNIQTYTENGTAAQKWILRSTAR